MSPSHPSCPLDVTTFTVDLAHELRRVQLTYADGSGYMSHWLHVPLGLARVRRVDSVMPAKVMPAKVRR